MIKRTLITGFIMVAALSTLLSATAVQTSYAEPDPNCDQRLITFPAWYNGLQSKTGAGSTCELIGPADLPGGQNSQLSRYVWKIGLNVVDIILQLVAYVAVGFVIYGGFKYISSTGRADKIKEGRELILNAVIGLVISILAATIVFYIGRSL